MAQHLKQEFHELIQLPPSRPASTESTLQQFPLTGPEKGKYHNFDELNVHHYYIATSQYFKMLYKKPPFKPHKKITNVSESIDPLNMLSIKKPWKPIISKRENLNFPGRLVR